MSDELLPFMAASFSPSPVREADMEALKRAGCSAKRKEILAAFLPDERPKVRDFLIYDRKHGPKILRVFLRLVRVAQARGWPLPLGADTLRGWARGTRRRFHIVNDFVPFYVAGIAVLCPELRHLLTREADLPERLLAAGWRPRFTRRAAR